ncbi:MAG: phosphoglucosamine mutase [Methanobacterium sp. BRmetb2]|jgi:phosphoglucosamine mutase|nr:MAG: phosphoglucosamine mutase [Methanobacterium sp. BRmetb2]
MDDDIPKLFGTSGIRGKVDEKITPELAMDVGKALATYIGGKNRNIVIGYDTRVSSEMLENSIISGILRCGCNVLKVGMVPTPVVGYATMKLQADAGIMITASHNTAEYNGIKLWNNSGMAYTQEQERAIERIIHNNEFKEETWEHIGKIKDIKYIISYYMDELLKRVKIKHHIKVVVDCGNGAGSLISPILFRKAGCDVIALNCQPDGFFPGRNPEPNEENLQELMKVVKATKADLGIAHDGDADRMIAVDDKGNIADFDKTLALVSSMIGGKVVTTVDASVCVEECVKNVGGEVLLTKVGDVHVAEAIADHDASFGGEPSGTWLHPDFCMCPDGILSGLKLAEIVTEHGSLFKLLEDIPSYPTIRDKIICDNIDKERIMESVREELHHNFNEVADVNYIDGVRITMTDGSWVLVRPSGTESYIRITLEAKTPEMASEIRNISTEFIRGML